VVETTTSVLALPGLSALWAETSGGDSEIRIAVLDGPVDESHPCFDGKEIQRLPTLVPGEAMDGGIMSSHGTHITSIIFGQPGSPVSGIAPKCQAIIVPVFGDLQEGQLSQLDLARAIEQAVEAGAHVINISGGQFSPSGQADDALARAIRFCAQSNVLVVAAAGNDGCECLHVPAALPTVLAVGALGRDGRPLPISNWGEDYHENGVLALGEDISGAVPGGGIAAFTGSSFATPIVAGVAALLLSLQRKNGQDPNPLAVRAAILQGARKCDPRTTDSCDRFLAGTLDISGALAYLTKGTQAMSGVLETSQIDLPAEAGVVASTAKSISAEPRPAEDAGVAVSADCGCGVQPSAPANGTMVRSNIYALGTIGTDFGTEARRDSFRQLMPHVDPATGRPPPQGAMGATTVPANPYDSNQLSAYLDSTPSESTKLIWTLNLELTPIYAIEAETPYAEAVYKRLRDALAGEALPDSDPSYVSRVSIPGFLSGRTVRLFSGQILPVVVVQPRGLYTWNEPTLVSTIIEAVGRQAPTDEARPPYEEAARSALRNFLDKIYFQLRNLGQTSPDRALNYAATNVFQSYTGILAALNPKSTGLIASVTGSTGIYTLDTVSVTRSPFCRMDSDCWDVRISFFDPENVLRARFVLQYTIDVSDEMPVSLGPSRMFATIG